MPGDNFLLEGQAIRIADPSQPADGRKGTRRRRCRHDVSSKRSSDWVAMEKPLAKARLIRCDAPAGAVPDFSFLIIIHVKSIC